MCNYNILSGKVIPFENRSDGPCAGCNHWKPWATSSVKGWYCCHFILDTGHKRPLNVYDCREQKKAALA